MLGRNSRKPEPTPRGRILLLLSRERNRTAQDRLLDDLLELDRQTLAGLEQQPDSDGRAGVDAPRPTP